MYQMHIQVNEYIGCFTVKAVVSDVDDTGTTHRLVSIPESLFDPVPRNADELTIMFHVLGRWSELQSNYRRVDPGVS